MHGHLYAKFDQCTFDQILLTGCDKLKKGSVSKKFFTLRKTRRLCYMS